MLNSQHLVTVVTPTTRPVGDGLDEWDEERGTIQWGDLLAHVD
jgi:hypothetical protein